MNAIQKLRESLGLSQAQFGFKMGVSQGAVSSWERGEKTPLPAQAKAITVLAKEHGIVLTLDVIYAEVTA